MGQSRGAMTQNLAERLCWDLSNSVRRYSQVRPQKAWTDPASWLICSLKTGHVICESPRIKGRTTTKVSRFSDEQVIHLLQQAEHGQRFISVLCREHGISEQTFYRWRKK